MSRIRILKQHFLCLLIALLFCLPLGIAAKAETYERNKDIYDSAGLLTNEEEVQLQALSSELGKERDTAFMIITVDGTDGKELKQYVEDFYDEKAPGYNQPHGNTAILAIDMQERDVYLAGFKKAEEYLDDGRLDLIREEITPDLSDGNYFQAFSNFITASHEYMGDEPGEGSGNFTNSPNMGKQGNISNQDYMANETSGNRESIFYQWWLQLIISLVLAGIIVAMMAYRSGGKVTANGQTYINSTQSKVINEYDKFVRKTITKHKKPSNNTNNSGGISSGGHSHSGSGGKF